MTDTTPQGWFDGVVSLLMLAVGYVLNLYRGKVDMLQDNQKSFVTREELAELIRDEKADSDRKHEQNVVSITNLTRRIDRVLERMK